MAIIYKIKDTDGNIHDIVDTDTKVTSPEYHYDPKSVKTAEITATLSGTAGAYALNTEYTVLTGVKAQRDVKGHITGLTYTAQKIKDTNTTGSSSDTKNTAGATNTNSKIYLVGATSQSEYPQTYSHSSVYVNIDHSIHALKFYQDSDERLKTFTEDYDVNLDDIKNIKTGRFYWNSDESQEINGGVSAQTVEAYFPELVKENEDGIKSVNYDGLAVVAIAAIKKLTERIEQLEDIIRNK